MPAPEHRRKREMPEWAQRERASDLAWIRDNLHVLLPAAQQKYAEKGRGALLIDTLIVATHSGGSGNPMFYLTEKALEKSEQHPDALRMVRAYDPAWELITVLLK